VLVKATITHMATLENLTVLWNPRSYSVHRTNHFASPAILGGGLSRIDMSAGGTERFTARLFLDSSERSGPARDLRAYVGRLESWAEPEPGGELQPELLFLWGSFRFQGVVEDLREEWIRFDPDGTPIRGWVDLTLRRCSR